MSPAGWLRAALRAIAMLAWLAVCLFADGFSRLLHRKRRWPRRFHAGLCRIIGLSVSCHGAMAQGRVLFLANHVSWLDIPALAARTGTAFVAHDGLGSVPLVRQLCALADTVFVARHRRSSVHGQIAAVRKALAELGALALFPEGTTSDGTGLLPFKSALLSAVEPLPDDIAVQPVLFVYRDSAAIAWVGEEHGLANFIRILGRKKPVELALHFLAPLEGSTLANRKTIAAGARQAMLDAQPLHPGPVLP